MLHLKIEESWNVAVREARSQSFKLAELSTTNIYNADMPTWAVVTERNRKRGVEITLHVVSDGSFKPKKTPEDGVHGDVGNFDGRFGSLEVVSTDELKQRGAPVIEYRPNTTDKKDNGTVLWNVEVQSLLEGFYVEDSVKITVFQRANPGRRVRRLAAAWDREETSPLRELREYCEKSLSSLDGAARTTARVLCGNSVEEARALLKYTRRPDGVPDPFLQLRPIHWAVMGQNIDIVELVLEAGADPLGLSDRRFTTLHLAAMLGDEAITDLLLDKLYPIYLGDGEAAEGRGHAKPTTGTGDYPIHFAAAYATVSSF